MSIFDLYMRSYFRSWMFVPFLLFLNNQMKYYICSVTYVSALSLLYCVKFCLKCMKNNIVMGYLIQIIPFYHIEVKFNTFLWFSIITWTKNTKIQSNQSEKKMVISQNDKAIKICVRKIIKFKIAYILFFFIFKKSANLVMIFSCKTCPIIN